MKSQNDCLLRTEAFIGLNLKSNASPSTIKNLQISEIFEWLRLTTPLLTRTRLTKLTRKRSAPSNDGSLVSSHTVYSAVAFQRKNCLHLNQFHHPKYRGQKFPRKSDKSKLQGVQTQNMT